MIRPPLAAALEALLEPATAQAWGAPLQAAGEAAELTSDRRRRHFLAQTLHESAGLRLTEENLNYSAAGLLRTWPGRFTPATAAALAHKPASIANHVYGGRLGNTQPGDGWRYRGRGLLQLTGRGNYAAYAAAAGRPEALLEPALVAQPRDAARSSAWYWTAHDVNQAADRDDLEAVTRLINGGLTGLADRRRWLELARAALPAQPLNPPSGHDGAGRLRALVLHDLSDADHRALLRAWLDGQRSVALPGPWATRLTADPALEPKLDARRSTV